MVPEVQALIKENLLDEHDISYPVAEVIMAAGFFMVLSIEIFVMDYNRRSDKINMKIEEIASVSNGVTNEKTDDKVEDDPHRIETGSHHNDHSPIDHHISRSFILMVALSLHHFFEGII